MANQTIRLDIEVDASKGTAAIKQFAGDAEAATKKAGEAAKEGGKGFGQFASSLDETAAKLKDLLTPTNLLGAGIGVGLVAALDSAMAATQAFGGEIRRLQLITGASTEELSALNVAQVQLGGSSETLQRAMFLMSREIEAGGDKLSQLGISIRDSGGAMKNEVSLLYEVSDALSGMTNRAQAAAKAREIFGRGAADLLPLLLAGRERIQELGLSAEELGVSLSAGASKALFEARVASNVFDTALLGVKNTITQDFLPAHELMLSTLTATAKLWIQMPSDVRLLIEVIVTLTASVIALGVAFTALKTITAAIGFTTLLSSVGSFLNIGAMVAAVTASLAALGPTLAALVLTATVSFLFDIGGIRAAASNLASTLTTWLIDQIRSIVGLPPIEITVGPKGGGTWKDYWDMIALGYQNLLEKLSGQPLTPALNVPTDQSNIFKPRLGMPPIEVDTEKLVSERQILLHLDQQLGQAETELARATLPALEAQLVAVQKQNAAKLEGLAIEAIKYRDTERAVKVAQAIHDTEIAGLAMENKVRSDIYVRDITQLNTTAQLKAKAELAGEDLIRKEHDLTIDLAKDILANRLKYGLSAVEANRVYNKAIEDADSKQTLSLIELDAKRATARAALNVQEIEATVAMQKQIETVRVAGVEADRKALDLKLKNFEMSEDQFITAAQDLEDKLLTIKLATIQKEEAAEVAKAIEHVSALDAQLLDDQQYADEVEKIQKTLDASLLALQGKRIEAGIAFGKQMTDLDVQRAAKSDQIDAESSHRELTLRLQELDQRATAYQNNADALQVIDAQRLDAYQKDRDTEIAVYAKAELLKTGILQDAMTRRIAREAEAIRKIQAERQKVIDDSALALEQQARQEGDLWTALEAGFAHAASSASDAFKAMGSAGTKVFDDLKSGASDFLYEILSTSGKIGDIFVNLGKRILRTMTDAFAEMTVKWAMTAAGFSLPSLLGVGTAAAATAASQVTQWQAATEAVSNVKQLSTSANEASYALTGVTSVTDMVINMFTVLTTGIGKFISFLTTMLSAAPGLSGIAGTLASLATSGGIGFGLGSLVFGSGAGGIGAGLGSMLGTGLNLAFSGIGDAVGGAIAGAFGMALPSILSSVVLPGIGFALGGVLGNVFSGLFGGLFGGPTPEISGKTVLQPTTIAGVASAQPAVHWGENGPVVVNPPGRSQFSYLQSGPFREEMYYHRSEGALSREQSQISIMNIILSTLQAAVTNVAALVPQMPTANLSTAVSNRLNAVLAAGFQITNFDVEGDDAVKQFGGYLKALSGKTLEAFGKQVFPAIDLKALGGGDVVKGWDALAAAMKGLGSITQMVSKDIDLSAVTLDQFATGSMKLFQQFAKTGEAFTDTIKRVGTALQGITTLQGDLRTEAAALSGDFTAGLAVTIGKIQQTDAAMRQMADGLTVLAASGGQPDALLTAAQQLKQVIESELSLVQQLQSQVTALNSAILSGLNLAVSLSQKIDTLRGTEQSMGDALAFSDQMIGLFNATTDVTMRIGLFSAGLLGAAENLSLLTERMPTVVAGFNMIMEQIRGMTNPQQALTALKSLSDGIEASLQADISAAQRNAQAQIAALNAEKSQVQSMVTVSKTALEQQKTLVTQTYNTQTQALQTALTLSQQWASVLQSVKTQLVDLFNLLAPTHPLTSLNEIRAQFQSAFAAFQAGPTTEGASQVQALAKQVLDLAKQTPGYELPSGAFQGLAGEVQTALTAIQTFAAAQPSQEEIQAQIAALGQQQANTLTSIDQQISVLDAQQSAQLAEIDQQIQATSASAQAQIAYFQDLAATGLELIRQQVLVETTTLAAQQAKAAAELQAILGDKTYEQFIASKQQEASDLLRGIDRTLQDYLGTIITNLFPGVAIPHMAEGGIVTRPTLALIGERGPEAVIPLRQGGASAVNGNTTVSISFTYAGSARKDEWDRFLDTVIDDARFGKLSKVITEKVKGH